MEDELAHPPLQPPLHNSSAPRDKEPDDIQKLLKWQEDRLARKLRGEYESAVLQLSELINSNLHTSVNIDSVRVEGATNTRESFLGSIIKPVLSKSSSKPEHQSDLEATLHTAREIASLLRKTDIFSSVEARVDRARSVLAQEGDVDLIFKTKERGRFYLNSSTELGNNEGSASATARVRNVFGGAETFEANISMGTKTRRSFRASLAAPLTSDLCTYGDFSIYGMERDNSAFASCMEGLKGMKAVVRRGTLDSGMHELAYEVVLRHVAGLTPTASISIREAAGHSIKSSVSHTYVRDTRDDRITSTRGTYAKLFQELAGLGGNASFYKIETEGQISRPVWNGISVSVAARTGLLWGLSHPSLFSDRFQLGGPTSVRSFRVNSMGPRDGSDSLGGDMYYSAGLSVISNIPKKPHWPMKAHAWVNAGRLDALDKCTCPKVSFSSLLLTFAVTTARPLSENIRDILSRPSVSAGIGLIYRFDPVRVEVNFGVPLVASKSDGYRKGLQVGMGLEFL